MFPEAGPVFMEFKLGRKNPRDEALFWFNILKSGEASARDRQKFREWLEESPEHEKEFSKLSSLWDDFDSLAPYLKNRVPVSASPANRFAPARIAAVVAFLLAGILAVSYLQNPRVWFSDYSTAVGEQRQVLLADQSSLFLNTNSALSVHYDEAGRRIGLHLGQVNFSPKSDAARPFIVDTPHLQILTVGTNFDVVIQEGRERIVLFEGALKIKSSEPGSGGRVPPLDLSAGQEIVFEDGALGRVRDVDPDRASAWHRGKLIFSDEPFQEALDEINRYHNTRFIVLNPELEKIRISGIFNIRDLDGILESLEHSFKVQSLQLGTFLVVLS